MKRVYRNIIIICFTILAGILFFNTKSYAASANISASSQNVNVGDNVTITVNATGCLSELSVSGPGVSGRVDIISTDLTNQSKTETYKLDTSSAGTKTVTLSGSVVDADRTEVNINKFVTVTVTEKQAQPTEQTPTQPTTPSQPTTPAKPQQQEASFSARNETVYASKDGINVRQSYSTSSKVVGSLKLGQSVTRTGVGSGAASGWSRVSFNGGTAYISSSLLTTTKPAEEPNKEETKKEEEKKEETSTNKALKELVVEDYKLTPDFDAETTKYSLTLKDKDEKLNIKAIPADGKAKVDITGNENFKVGNNIVKITVTAADGTTRIYSIAVTKSNAENNGDKLTLSTLKINNATLSPEFKPDVTNYEIKVDDPSSIKTQDITAKAADENVEVTIAENQKTENGEKIFTIMLENADGTKTGVYQITVKKNEVNPIAAIQNSNNNTVYYVLGAIIAVLLIFIIIIIVLLKKTSTKGDERDIKEEDELSDDYDYSLKSAIDEANSNEVLQEFDQIVEDSNVKSQILNTVEDYNVFEDAADDVGVDNDYGDDFDPDLKSKRKGKHF